MDNNGGMRAVFALGALIAYAVFAVWSGRAPLPVAAPHVPDTLSCDGASAGGCKRYKQTIREHASEAAKYTLPEDRRPGI